MGKLKTLEAEMKELLEVSKRHVAIMNRKLKHIQAQIKKETKK